MTHAHTIAVLIVTIVTTSLLGQHDTGGYAIAAKGTQQKVVSEREIVADDIIEGVRIHTENAEVIALATAAVQAYAEAGYPIDNTEIQYDENACTNAVGYHAMERGHHLVMLCTINEWTLLHELGHVWSDQYLDESRVDEWLNMRELESWGDGDWEERGTEHVAEIMAYGLADTMRVPMGIGIKDYRVADDAYMWLTGQTASHRR